MNDDEEELTKPKTPMNDVHLERVAKMIGVKPIFEFEGKGIHVVCVIPKSPPLIAPWGRGKEGSIIDADVDGNFFLRSSDGCVRYWRHAEESEVMVAQSVKEFVSGLRDDHNDSVSWWKKGDGRTST